MPQGEAHLRPNSPVFNQLSSPGSVVTRVSTRGQASTGGILGDPGPRAGTPHNLGLSLAGDQTP